MKTLYKSQTIPTPGIEKCSNYYLVQQLILQRIRCTLTGDKFVDTSYELAQKYLLPPPTCQTQEQVHKYLLNEARMIPAAFKLYEQTPDYIEAIKLLRTYEGSTFTIVNVTLGGIIVLIEVGK